MKTKENISKEQKTLYEITQGRWPGREAVEALLQAAREGRVTVNPFIITEIDKKKKEKRLRINKQ